MNIFYLTNDQTQCAQWHCNSHSVKMILEYAQLLSTAHWETDGNPIIECYKATHKNHPSAVWARANRSHYLWLHTLLEALCEEYTYRYGKTHKTQSSGIVDNLSTPPVFIDDYGFYDPPQCMPDEFKRPATVDAYRNYYANGKTKLLSYKFRDVPDWLKEYQTNVQ